MTVGLRCIESRQRHAWNQGRVVKTEQKGEGTRGGGGGFICIVLGPTVSRRWATITTFMESWVCRANSGGGAVLSMPSTWELRLRFCWRLKAAPLSCVSAAGASLLVSVDILTADTLWPLAYGNRVKAQPGLIVTSTVLGEVCAEVQA